MCILTQLKMIKTSLQCHIMAWGNENNKRATVIVTIWMFSHIMLSKQNDL